MEITDYANKMISVLYGAGCMETALIEQVVSLEPKLVNSLFLYTESPAGGVHGIEMIYCSDASNSLSGGNVINHRL